jgi:hypothetical protein
LRLTVATGDRSLREAAEKLPVSLTATIIDIASRRSICPFFQFSEKLLLDHADCASALQSDSNGPVEGFRVDGRQLQRSTYGEHHQNKR